MRPLFEATIPVVNSQGDRGVITITADQNEDGISQYSHVIVFDAGRTEKTVDCASYEEAFHWALEMLRRINDDDELLRPLDVSLDLTGKSFAGFCGCEECEECHELVN